MMKMIKSSNINVIRQPKDSEKSAPVSRLDVLLANDFSSHYKPQIGPTYSSYSSSRKSLWQQQKVTTSLIKKKDIIIKKPIEVDNFVRTARKIDHKCQALSDTIISISNLEQRLQPDFVPQWIGDYVRSVRAHGAALKIQTKFRLYIEKKNWKGVIHHRIWNRLDALRRIFVGWRGYASKDINIIGKCYCSFATLFKEKPWLSVKQTLSPFRYFYLSGRWFYPENHKPRNIYWITRLLQHSSAHRILVLWKSISHSVHSLRHKNQFYWYTIAKRKSFGFIFVILLSWHRYTEWKKLSKKYEKSCFLSFSECIIEWNVLERKLNVKKTQIHRANLCSLFRIKKKTFNAIYQNNLDHIQELNDLESSFKFYLRHLQERARKAWAKYLIEQRLTHAETRKIMKSWYAYTFQKARRKCFFSSLRNYIKNTRLARCLMGWQQAAHQEHLIVLGHSLKLQQNPSLAYLSIFNLMNQKELCFFNKAWREWIALARRRKLWRAFSTNFMNNNQKKEEKQKIFYALQRAAQFKLVKKFSHTSNRFFPHLTPFSYEGMKFFLNQITFSIKSDRRTSITNNNWKFITQNRNDGPIPKSNSVILARSLLLALNKYKRFEQANLRDLEEDEFNKTFECLRSYKTLVNQYNSNRDQMRKVLLFKIKRDTKIFSAVCSHYSALEYHNKIDNMFKVADDATMLRSLESNDTPLGVTLRFFKESQLSINFLLDQNQEPRNILPIYKQKFTSSISNFNQTYRLPKLFIENENEMENPIKKSHNIIKVTPKTNNSAFDKYKRPLISEIKFPIPAPKLKEIKNLKTSTENQTKSATLISRQTTEAIFGVKTYEELIKNLTLTDILNCLRRFFTNMSEIRIDVSNPIEYQRGNLKAFDFIPDENRHHVRRNINAFIAEMCGQILTKTIPTYIRAEPYIYFCISSCLTVYTKIVNQRNIIKYCDAFPFCELIKLNSPQILSIRSAIIARAFEKFPKLAKEARCNIGSRRKNSLVKIGKVEPEDFTHQDVNVSAFLLPHIMKPGLIKSFLYTEVKVDKTIQTVPEEELPNPVY